MSNELNIYPWSGMLSILKACKMSMPTDNKSFFDMLCKMRKIIGKNRNWRGRINVNELKILLSVFNCNNIYNTPDRTSLYKWIASFGIIHSCYIVLVTGQFVFVSIGDTLENYTMQDQFGIHGNNNGRGKHLRRKIVCDVFMIQ